MRCGTGRPDAEVDLRVFSTVAAEAEADTLPPGPVMAAVVRVTGISRAGDGVRTLAWRAWWAQRLDRRVPTWSGASASSRLDGISRAGAARADTKRMAGALWAG